MTVRLFLDSNVITGGIVGLDKAVLSLCAARVCRLVLADAVRDEVEEMLAAEQLIEDYRRLVKLTAPEIIPYPKADLVRRSRHLIRHAADVPVLLSAMAARPDWLLTNNTRHFTRAVARRTGLRIAKPTDFFRVLAASLRLS